MTSPTRAQEDRRRTIDVKVQANESRGRRTASPGSYSGRRQRRTSLRRSLNSKSSSPKRSGRRNLRSPTLPRDESCNASAMPSPLRLNRNSSGGNIRKGRRSRRASTGTEGMPAIVKGRNRRASIGIEGEPVIVKGRNRRANIGTEQQIPGIVECSTGRRSGCEDPSATKHFLENKISTRRSRSPRRTSSPSPGPVRRSFHRDCSINLNRAAMNPKRNSDQSSSLTSEWNEMKVQSNLQQNDEPYSLNSSTASWESFETSFRNRNSSSEGTCTRVDRLEGTGELSTVLDQIRDPAKLERMAQERRRRSAKTKTRPNMQHSKVTEKVNRRNILNFIKKPSRRGYDQQSNFDSFRRVAS